MNAPTGRFMLLAPLALLILCGLMIWSLQLGSVALSWRQTMAALGLSSAPLSGMLDTIVVQLRLPRALLAALTGAGLAMTGALLQTTTRNELADPFLFGLSSGASAGAVLVITRFGDALGALTLPLSAFAGGILSAMAVMILFRVSRIRRAEQLIVCGLAVSFLFSALTSYLVFSGDQRAAGSVLFWSLGGLGLARWENLFIPLVSFVLLVGFTALRWRALDALLAGEQTAHSMGVNVARLRSVLRTVHGVSRFTDGRDRFCRADGALSGPTPGGRASPFVRADVRLAGGDAADRRRHAQPQPDPPSGTAHRHHYGGAGGRIYRLFTAARGAVSPLSIKFQVQALLLNQRLAQVFRPAGFLQRCRHGMFQILSIAAQVDVRPLKHQLPHVIGMFFDRVLHVVFRGAVAGKRGNEPIQYAILAQRLKLFAVQEVFIAAFFSED